MRKLILASVLGLALCMAPSVAQATPPGFYSSGYATTVFPAYPAVQTYNYYASPYGYQTFYNAGLATTPW
jgi:hypothetical protein